MAYLKSLKGLPVLLSLVLMSACVQTSRVFQSGTALAPPTQASVLILPPDVLVSERKTGGELEPRADWTETVTDGLVAGIQDNFYTQGVKFVSYKGEGFKDEHVSFVRQLNVVLDAVELSQTQQTMDVERQYGVPESEVQAFEEYDADYALFVVLRVNRASGGRKAVSILSSIALALVGGVGAASAFEDATFRVALLDLRDGQVAYANFDPLALTGLGRNLLEASPERWEKAISHLLREFPL